MAPCRQSHLTIKADSGRLQRGYGLLARVLAQMSKLLVTISYKGDVHVPIAEMAVDGS